MMVLGNYPCAAIFVNQDSMKWNKYRCSNQLFTLCERATSHRQTTQLNNTISQLLSQITCDTNFNQADVMNLTSCLQVASLSVQNERVLSRFGELEAKLELKQQQLQELKLNQLRTELAMKETLIKSQDKAIADKSSELTACGNLKVEKDLDIAQLKAQINYKDDQLIKLEQSARKSAENEREMGKTNEQLLRLESQLAQQAELIRKLDTESAAKSAKMIELEKNILIIEAKYTEKVKQLQKIDEIYERNLELLRNFDVPAATTATTSAPMVVANSTTL